LLFPDGHRPCPRFAVVKPWSPTARAGFRAFERLFKEGFTARHPL
jgi:hypothetical protein